MPSTSLGPDTSSTNRSPSVSAFLIGFAFLVLAAIDFFIAHPPYTSVQLVVKVFLGINGLLLVAASTLAAVRGVLRPALLAAFTFLGLVAAGLVYRLTLSLLHADSMAPFLLTLLVPAIAIGSFAFFIWHGLRPPVAQRL
jgi:hypothetical protein